MFRGSISIIILLALVLNGCVPKRRYVGAPGLREAALSVPRESPWRYYANIEGIRCMASDGESLWFGSLSGVGRYDIRERRWRIYRTSDGLPSNWVTSIQIDGRYVWVGTSEGVARFDKGKGVWERIGGEGVRNVISLLLDGNTLWIGIAGGGIMKFDKGKGRFEEIDDPNSLPNADISAIAASKDEVWFGSRYAGLTVYDKASGKWSLVLRSDVEENLKRANIEALEISSKGDVWVGLGSYGSYEAADAYMRGFTRGLYRFIRSQGKWVVYTERDWLPSNQVYSIKSIGDEIWCGTSNGIVRFNPETGDWKVYGEEDGLPGSWIWSLACDSRYIWAGSQNGGIARMKRGEERWELVLSPKERGVGLPGNNIRTLLLDGSKLWISTDGGIAVMDTEKEEVERVPIELSGMDLEIRSMAKYGESILFGTLSGFLFEVKGDGSWRKYTVLDGLPDAWISSVAVDGKSIWIGTLGKGVARWDRENDKWEYYTVLEGLSSNWISCISCDGEFVWVGTYASGISRLEKRRGVWEVMTKLDGLPDNRVRAIAQDRGRVWIGTLSGLCYYDRDTRTIKPFGSGYLPDPWIKAIAVDERRLWVGTPKGIAVFDKEKGVWRRLDSSDGLLNPIITSLALGDRCIWIGSWGGLARYEER
jgi:ligand-binding sensor domain-containing protein